MRLIIDKDVDLNEEDLLETKVYAITLKDLIQNSPKNEPLTTVYSVLGVLVSHRLSQRLKRKSGLIPQPEKTRKINQRLIQPSKISQALPLLCMTLGNMRMTRSEGHLFSKCRNSWMSGKRLE